MQHGFQVIPNYVAAPATMGSPRPLFRTQKPTRSFIRFIALAAFCLAVFSLLNVHNPSVDQHWDNSRPSTASSSSSPPPSPSQPSPAPTTIPKRLWYKFGPKGLSDATRGWTSSCIDKNSGYTVQFMSDASADSWVQKEFAQSYPELVELYLNLTVPIWKADILRYLLLYTEGGIYLDLDVTCEAPIAEWLPSEYEGRAGLVVGWEFDVGWGTEFVRQFETWTIMAKPRSPHIWMVIQDIVQSFYETMTRKDVPIEGLTIDMFNSVIDATGPRAFTRNVLKSIEEAFGTKLEDIQELMEPRLVGDVLVLPGYAFAADSNTYDKGFEVPPALVKHHYAGTWRNDNGGETP